MSASNQGFTESVKQTFIQILKIMFPQIPLKHALVPRRHQTCVTVSGSRTASHTWGFLAGQHDAKH